MNSNFQQWSPNPYYVNQGQNPYHVNQSQNPYYNLVSQTQQLKQQTLSTVEPIVQYGLKETKISSHLHAMREVAAISYLIGRGYDPQNAHQIVESWEINEMFYR